MKAKFSACAAVRRYPDSGMYNELNERMQKYLAEFDANGVENVTVDGID